MKQNRILILTFSLLCIITCIAATEVLLHYFAPIKDPYEKYYQILNQHIKNEGLGRNAKLTDVELEEELPGADGKGVFSTNNMGFRGDYMNVPKPENEYRIFMIGGSTTECFYIDDSKSVDAILQKELQSDINSETSIKVFNAGISGTKSYDHIALLMHRIIHLEPDMIILFLGINDLNAAIYNIDYLHFLKSGPRKKFPVLSFLATEFQIPRRIYYLVKQIAPTEQELFEVISVKSNYLKQIDLLKEKPVTDLTPRTDLRLYSNNIKTIIGAAKAHNVQLVLMTQQSTYNSTVDPTAKEWHWALYYYNKSRFQEDKMHYALESYNDVLRELSREYSVPLFDLARIIPKSSEYFYDDYHFNTKGADFAGRELSSFILQEGIIEH